mmetsp:Transcript_85628/g.239165  ORF Transcript_85628/g.239165 Transcript_85628/m.239165 type:complete len:223 (+) Transcript_85628:1128-1796(+)
MSLVVQTVLADNGILWAARDELPRQLLRRLHDPLTRKLPKKRLRPHHALGCEGFRPLSPPHEEEHCQEGEPHGRNVSAPPARNVGRLAKIGELNADGGLEIAHRKTSFERMEDPLRWRDSSSEVDEGRRVGPKARRALALGRMRGALVFALELVCQVSEEDALQPHLGFAALERLTSAMLRFFCPPLEQPPNAVVQETHVAAKLCMHLFQFVDAPFHVVHVP